MSQPYRILNTLLALSLGLMMLLSCPARAQSAAPSFALMVRIGDENVDQKTLREYAQARVDLRALLASDLGMEAIARDYALARVLVLEGQARGIQDDQPNAAADDTSPYLVMDRYAEKVYRQLSAQCDLPNDEVVLRDYYEKNPEAFSTPTRLRLSRVVLPLEKRIDIFDATTWLQVQAHAVALGQTSFENIVQRAQSEVPNIHQGDIGWTYLVGDDPLIGALQSAEAGNLVGPVRIGRQVVLLRVDDKMSPQRMPWEAVRHQAHTAATEHCRNTEREKVMRTLFERYGVRIEWKPTNGQ